MTDESFLHKPSQLKDVLASLIRRKGFVDTSAANDLDAVWKRIVGPQIGSRSIPRRVKGGILEVVVSNGAVLEQLRGFLHQQVLAEIQASLPESEIRGIRYVRSRVAATPKSRKSDES